MNKRAFTLFETMLAALILAIVGTGMAGVYMLEGSLSNRASHHLMAINYAKSAADSLIAIGRSQGAGILDPWFISQNSAFASLSSGMHTQTSDPDICTISDSYFKLHLNGTLTYNVDSIDIGNSISGCRVEVIVEWDEKFPKNQHVRESLYIIPYFYYFYPGYPMIPV